MKRLKELRQSARYSQEHLAEMLDTTQQTIARWETGAVEPSLRKLRDLALIFGVSVDDLLGENPLAARPPTTAYHLLGDGTTDGFWGHVGLLLDGRETTSWFPVTATTFAHLSDGLSEGLDWIAFPTLANKIVACRPENLRNIAFLDEAADGPEGDWVQDHPYEGLPLETYRAFAKLSDAPFDKAQWAHAADILERRDDEGALEPRDAETWQTMSERLASAVFEGEASEPFLSHVVQAFVKGGLHDPDAYYALLYHTQVHLAGGETHAFWAEGESLTALLSDIEHGDPSRLIRLEQFGGGAENYFPAGRIAAVVMPLIEVMDAEREAPADD